MMALPSKSQTDKQIKYIRYADDFIIGVNGDKTDCEEIKSELKAFLNDRLKMELSEEKTLITHSSNYARFLGYNIKVRRCNQVKQGCYGLTKRTLNNNTELTIPLKDKIEKFLFGIKAVKIKNGALFPQKRGMLVRLTDLEIIATYNAELRGICNYYNLSSNYGTLKYFAYLMEYSCLHTLAAKHRSNIGKLYAKYKDRQGKWCIPYETKNRRKQMYFAKYQECKNNSASDVKPIIYKYTATRSSFEQRLKANICELCGDTDSKYEIHHVNKVKNLKGKQQWERVMIAKKRKTLVVCYDCHLRIHGRTNKKSLTN
jgi:hypothetical protein